MKGTPRPSWSEGRHQWLAALKAGTRKPKGVAQGSVATYCRALGWSAIRPPVGHVITAEGLAMLERWEGGDRALAPKPKPPSGAKVLQLSPDDLATRLVEIGLGHAREVYDALHVALHLARQEPPAPAVVEEAPAPTECAMDAGDFSEPCTCPPEQEDEPRPLEAARPSPTMAAHLGKRVAPRNYTECLRCRGRGTVAHGFVCPACHGAGTIKRTVEP